MFLFVTLIIIKKEFSSKKEESNGGVFIERTFEKKSLSSYEACGSNLRIRKNPYWNNTNKKE